MHQFSAFPDLRQNKGAHTAETSLWPSFTDIMTVVLMIFMLTMIAVIIQNSDLVQKLLQKEAQYQEIEEELENIKMVQFALQSLNTELEAKIQAKEMENILIQDEKNLVQSILEQQETVISLLRDSTIGLVQMLQERDSSLSRLKMDHTQQLAALSERINNQLVDFNRRYALLKDSLVKLRHYFLETDSERKGLALQLAKQRNAYSLLEEKYNKLVKPARSPMGKQVVTIHYSRQNQNIQILFKDIGSATFEKVSSEQMHQRLAARKKQLQQKLYVKVVIPDNSGLSYNEAWSFTQRVLSLYDYYYQDKQKTE